MLTKTNRICGNVVILLMCCCLVARACGFAGGTQGRAVTRNGNISEPVSAGAGQRVRSYFRKGTGSALHPGR